MFLVDSPFADRLHTNYTPSDSEMEQLRMFLVESTNEFAQLDAQIAEMDVLIGQLRAEQASLQAKIFAHRALMSTIRRVPVAAEGGHRKAAGLTAAQEDWTNARSILTVLKTNTMRPIKSDKANKSAWGEQRRKIRPKIGQLTNEPSAIRDITDFIYDKIMPPQRHPPMLYTGLLSSLGKTILLQAETEVTAQKKAAIPLAQVAFTLLDRLETFPDIFFAKLVQRCGGWPIPCVVPGADFDGRPWADDAERAKMMGYRRSVEADVVREPIVEYMNRVAGDMRLYFHILRIPPQTRPMHPMFQLPRCWTWFARIMGDYALLESPVAAQLIYTALDVLGSHALEVWGQQWVKMLELIYEGATVGFAEGRFIGGSSGVGISARSRVRTEVERIMAGAR